LDLGNMRVRQPPHDSHKQCGQQTDHFPQHVYREWDGIRQNMNLLVKIYPFTSSTMKPLH